MIQALGEIALLHGYPVRILLDNGPEFRSTKLDAWSYERGVALDFIQPGKPIQNAFMERSQATIHDEGVDRSVIYGTYRTICFVSLAAT